MNYDDIIHLPHPVSVRHGAMSNLDRAAQFAPFAALTGYDGVSAETARLTDFRLELTESAKQELNEKLRLLAESVLEKLEQITDKEFAELDFYPDF